MIVMKLSKKATFILLVLLVVLNILLRYPLTLHEIGMDSFAVHILGNSISMFGYAKWWYHPTAILGFYPYTEISGVPFYLSALNQTTNMDMEAVVFLSSVFLGILSAFTAYLAASVIFNNSLYKFLVAFGFSLSMGVLNYTTFTTPDRGLFVVLLPLFIYSLMKCRVSLKYILLTIICALILTATHHLSYFLVLILVSFLMMLTLNKLSTILRLLLHQEIMPFTLISGFIALIAFSFFTGFLIQGSRYGLLADTFIKTYPRYIGMLYIPAIGGFTYLIFKQFKKPSEWFLLFCTLLLTPFIFEIDYFLWIILIFTFLFAGIGLLNIYNHDTKIKYSILISFLIVSIVFTGFFQFYYPFLKEKDSETSRYTQESTYDASMWIKYNTDGTVVSNDLVTGIRASASSGKPFFLGYKSIDPSYGFGDDLNNVTLKRGDPLSTEFWLSSPYSIVDNYINTEYYWTWLMMNKPETSGLISKYNLKYVMENKKTNGEFIMYNSRATSDFLKIVNEGKSLAYDNGKIAIWLL